MTAKSFEVSEGDFMIAASTALPTHFRVRLCRPRIWDVGGAYSGVCKGGYFVAEQPDSTLLSRGLLVRSLHNTAAYSMRV